MYDGDYRPAGGVGDIPTFSNPNSGGGGSGTQQVWNDLDPAAPEDPDLPATSYNTTTGVYTQWVPEHNAWE